jgi:MFS transporter, DHA1 family, tetracycline resistance protein
MSQNLEAREIHRSDAACELRAEQLETKNLRLLNSPLAFIFITVFIDLIGFGIVIPILPYYVEEFGGTPFEVGLLFAAYSAMQFLFAPVWGQLSDQMGRRPILFWSLLGTSVGFFILGLANALWLVFLGRILSGIMGANISTAQAYIADVTTEENRARGMGMIGAAFGLGFIFGPALGGILSQFGTHTPFYFAAVLALVNAVLLYFFLPETVKKSNVKKPHKSRFAVLAGAFKQSRFAVVTLLYFLVITAFSIMTTAFSLYTAYRFGYDAAQNGYLFAYIGALSVIMQGGLIGILSRKFGETKLIAAGCLILVVSLFLVPYVSPTNGGLLGLLAGIAMFAVGNAISTPSLTSLGSKLAPADEQGATLGVLQSSASLARAVGPALAGVLLYSAAAPQHIDDHTLFLTYWTAAGIMFVAFLLSLYFVKNGDNARLISATNAGD